MDFSTGFAGSLIGRPDIFVGEIDLSDFGIGPATLVFFLETSSLRVAFNAGRTAVGLSPLANLVFTGVFLIAPFFIFGCVLKACGLFFLVKPVFLTDFVVFDFTVIDLAADLFILGLGLAAEFFVVGFPLSNGFALTLGFAALLFLAPTFDAPTFDETALATALAGFFATLGLADALLGALPFVPLVNADLTAVFFFDALATAFTNRC